MPDFLKNRNFWLKFLRVAFILIILGAGIWYLQFFKKPIQAFFPDKIAFSGDENTAYISASGKLGIFDNLKQKLSLSSASFGVEGTEIIVGADNRVYVADLNQGAVFFYDNDVQKASIKTGSLPRFLFLNNKTKKLFVYNRSSQDISVINADDYSVSDTIEVNTDITGGVLDEKSDLLFLSSRDHQLIIIDGETFKTRTIEVGLNPYISFPAAFNKEKEILYLTSAGDNRLWAIDTASGKILNNVSIEKGAEELTLNDMGTKLYLANSDKHAVFIFDSKDLSVKKISVSPLLYPQKALADEKNGLIYVYNKGRVDEITVLDMDGKTIKSVLLGYSLSDFKFSPKTSTVYALSRAGGFMMVLKNGEEPNFIYKKPEIIETKLNWPSHLEIGSSKTLYVLDDFSNIYLAFDPKSLKLNGELSLAGGPYSTIFTGDPIGGTYITNKGIGEIWHLNPTHLGTISVMKKISIGKNIISNAALRSVKKIYLASDNSVIVIDSEKDEIIKTIDFNEKPDIIGADQNSKKVIIKIGNGLLGFIDGEKDEFQKLIEIKNINKTWFNDNWFNNLNPKIFVVSGDKNLRIIDVNTNKIIQTMPLSKMPSEISVIPALKKIYLLNSGDNKLLVLDSDSLKTVASIDINSSGTNVSQATAIYPDEKTNKIYLTHRYGQITVVDALTNKIIKVIPLPYAANPVSLRVDSDNNRLYVANKWLNQIQVYDLKDYLLQATIDYKGETSWP